MSATRRTGLLLALATAGISGVSVLLNGSAVRAFGDPIAYTTAKNLVAAAILLGAVAAAPTGARLTRPSGAAAWVGLGLVGLLGGAVAFVLFFSGLALAGSPVQAAFVHKTLVLWVGVLAVLVLRERVGPWHWAAIGLLLVGQAGLAGGLIGGWGRGETLILVATLLWAGEVVLAKRLLAGLSSWTVACARMVLGSSVLVGWVVGTGRADALTGLSAGQWLWVLVTGSLLAGYVATWFAALARAGALDVTAVLVLGAVVTSVLSAIVRGQPLAPQAGWVAVLLGGGALILWQAWTRPAPPAGGPGAASAAGPAADPR